MAESTPPERRSAGTAALDRSLLATLAEMLDDNETISARAAARRMGNIDHASTLTRDAWRAAVTADFQEEQARVRRQVEKADKSSRTNLSAALAREQARVVELEGNVALLTASHHALILAVGELGGLRAWSRFFENYRSAIDGLRDLGALPVAEVLPLPQTARREGDD